MGHGNAVLAHDVPEHREVVGDAGAYFKYRNGDDLARQLSTLLCDEEMTKRYRSLAERRVRDRYSWDGVADQYEAYFEELVAARGPVRD
jgi:glycosyltransferase involved in cell wall biosynthesis